jgi:hypothetical protein
MQVILGRLWPAERQLPHTVMQQPVVTYDSASDAVMVAAVPQARYTEILTFYSDFHRNVESYFVFSSDRKMKKCTLRSCIIYIFHICGG